MDVNKDVGGPPLNMRPMAWRIAVTTEPGLALANRGYFWQKDPEPPLQIEDDRLVAPRVRVPVSVFTQGWSSFLQRSPTNSALPRRCKSPQSFKTTPIQC